MVEDYALRRREYVAEIRKSFEEDTNEMGDAGSEAMESGIPILFFKIRFFLALCIFVAFLFCKYTGSQFYQWNTSEVIEIISDNQYYTNLQDYVMIQEQASGTEEDTHAEVSSETGNE